MRMIVCVLLLLIGRQSSAQVNVFADKLPEQKPNHRIVVRHLYMACVDCEAKQPAWVAYRVQKRDWDTENQLVRNFTTPRELRDICLEPGDFHRSGMEMGHLYALQFVSARQDASEVNQMCAVAAQSAGLNKGPWLAAETEVKRASETETVTVLAGQLWLTDMPKLPQANETHKVASHLYLMWYTPTRESAYLFPQSAARSDSLQQYKIDRACLEQQISPRWISQ